MLNAGLIDWIGCEKAACCHRLGPRYQPCASAT